VAIPGTQIGNINRQEVRPWQRQGLPLFQQYVVTCCNHRRLTVTSIM